MSNYTQTTNFATKDALASGNPLKIVKGTEINTEFANIATAVATKADTASPTFTGTVTIPTLTATTVSATTISSNPIFSAGTANGVAYLNGSKTLTTGTTLVFDGTNFGVGATPGAGYKGLFVDTRAADSVAIGIRNLSSSGITRVVLGNDSGLARYTIGYTGSTFATPSTAWIGTEAAEPIYIKTNDTERLRLTSAGALSVGATGTNTGTVGQFLYSQGSGSPPTWASATNLATPVATTSGTSIDFTSIPSWVKRITVMFSGVSTTGTSVLCIQIGTSSGVETAGYASAYNNLGGGAAGTTTAAFGLVTGPVAAYLYSGIATLVLLNASTNSWALSSQLAAPAGPGLDFGAGSKSLAAVLDRVRLTTLGGANTFDAGSINIMYE